MTARNEGGSGESQSNSSMPPPPAVLPSGATSASHHGNERSPRTSMGRATASATTESSAATTCTCSIGGRSSRNNSDDGNSSHLPRVSQLVGSPGGSGSSGGSSGGGGIPPLLARQRSLSHGQSPHSSPLSGRHPRIALGAPVPCRSNSAVGSGQMTNVPLLPHLAGAAAAGITTPPGTPIVPVHTIPGGGVLPMPLTPTHVQKKAIEHALEAERKRIKDLETKEKDMDADGLRVALRRERQHSTRLAADLAALWSSAVQSQADAEINEENRINGLMRRLDKLQREKGRIIVELEREEEMLTNTLQRKLNEVRREKALLEKQIEREHEEQARLVRQQHDAHVSRGASSMDVHVSEGESTQS